MTLDLQTLGGPGSGNFGHQGGEGGPGNPGGSTKGSTIGSTIAHHQPVVLDSKDGPITFQTGTPVTFPYFRQGSGFSDPKSPLFGQHIEPHGPYVSFFEKGAMPSEKQERGDITFHSPLVLNGEGGYNEGKSGEIGPLGWKSRLSSVYGGKRGLALSHAVRKDGYDGIVTVILGTAFPYVGEIVDLRNLRGAAIRSAGGPGSGNFGHQGGEGGKGNPGGSTKGLTSTPAFKAWFGGSKVVDANGKPLVVYHGTYRDIEAFDPNAQSRWSSPMHRGTGAIWFTANPDAAAHFVEDRRGAIFPVFISLQNPLIIDAAKDPMSDLEGFRLPGGKKVFDITYSKAGAIQRAKREGHDGVIFVNGYDGAPASGDIYAVFAPEQIKSAISNTGAFSRTSKLITGSLTHFPLAPAHAARLLAAAIVRVQGMRAAWDPSQPRDEQGQWTSGGGDRQAFVESAIQRGEAHTVTEEEFLKYHVTGHIPSNAYERYESGDFNFVHKEEFNTLLDTREVNGQTVEIRLQTEPARYGKRTVAASEEEGDRLYTEFEEAAKKLGTTPMMMSIDLGRDSKEYDALMKFEQRWRDSASDWVRDSSGNLVYESPQEMQEKGLPAFHYTVGAFVGDKAIGYAGDEFGASGVYVAREYQKHGLGLTLLKTYLDKSGKLAKGRKLGQMTSAGQELVRKLHRQIVKDAALRGAGTDTDIHVYGGAGSGNFGHQGGEGGPGNPGGSTLIGDAEAMMDVQSAVRTAQGQETPLHRAADAFIPKLSVAFRYAFAVGRRAVRGALRAAGSPDQPRDPAGTSTGGQWTSTGFPRTTVIAEALATSEQNLLAQVSREVRQEVKTFVRRLPAKDRQMSAAQIDDVVSRVTQSLLQDETQTIEEALGRLNSHVADLVADEINELRGLRAAASYASDLADLATAAMRTALAPLLPKLLLKVVAAGGAVGAEELLKRLENKDVE